MAYAYDGGGGSGSASFSSSYYNMLIEKCNIIIVKINGTTSYIDACKNVIKNGASCLEGVVINGESVGAKDIETFSSSIDGIGSTLSAITAECMSKRDEYIRLRDEALLAEQAAAIKGPTGGTTGGGNVINNTMLYDK